MLILRAYLVSEYGWDPQDEGQVMQAAAPLMQGLLDEGEIDAAIPYWHFVARMEGSGEFRDIQLVSELLAEMGFRDDLPILVVLGRDGADPAALTAFGCHAGSHRNDEDGQQRRIWQSIWTTNCTVFR